MGAGGGTCRLLERIMVSLSASAPKERASTLSRRQILEGEVWPVGCGYSQPRFANSRARSSTCSASGPNTASAFLDEWENVIECLKDGSVEHRLSRFEPLAKLGYHTVLVKGYIALYFKEEEDVVIAHLFHQSQDYASIVLNGE